MEQPVYADILFLINFSMDFLSLYLCAQILHLQKHTLRMVLSASVGAVYGVVSLFFTVGAVRSLCLNIAVALFMCAVAFSQKRPSRLIVSTLLFYGVGFLLGGTMTALYHLCNQYLFAHRVYQNGNYQTLEGDTSLPLFVLLAGVAFGVTLLLGRLFFAKGQKKTVELTLSLQEKTLHLTALIDSGNLLKDPVGSHPVLFLQYETAKEWLPAPLARFFSAPDPASFVGLPHLYAKRVRYVPVQTVQGKSTLYCLRADVVLVNGVSVDALLGIVQTKEAEFGGFCALCPPLPF